MRIYDNDQANRRTLSLKSDTYAVVDFMAYKAEHPAEAHPCRNSAEEEFEVIYITPCNNNSNDYAPFDDYDPDSAA